MLNSIFLGVRVFIWLYFLLSVILGILVLLHFKKEKIKEIYIKLRYPEKTIKVIIHYKNNLFKIFWRIIPSMDTFTIEGKEYSFNDKSLLKDNDIFSYGKELSYKIDVDGKQYHLDIEKLTKRKGYQYPELHYFYNYATPIEFDVSKKDIDFNAEQLNLFKENDLFSKLLTLDDTNMKLTLLFVFAIVNVLVSMFVVAKLMEWV